MDQFVVGGLYFMTWYADQTDQSCQDGLFLVPDSLVFIGKNLDADDDRETWYFQDTDSYCLLGAYPHHSTPGRDQSDARIYSLHEEDLYQVVDCQGLAKVLMDCQARRLKADKPA